MQSESLLIFHSTASVDCSSLLINQHQRKGILKTLMQKPTSHSFCFLEDALKMPNGICEAKPSFKNRNARPKGSASHITVAPGTKHAIECLHLILGESDSNTKLNCEMWRDVQRAMEKLVGFKNGEKGRAEEITWVINSCCNDLWRSVWLCTKIVEENDPSVVAEKYDRIHIKQLPLTLEASHIGI